MKNSSQLQLLLLLLLLVLSAGTSVQAQDARTVRGYVTDRATGEVLPGVTIRVEGTRLGAVTNKGGFIPILFASAMRSAGNLNWLITSVKGPRARAVVKSNS